MSPTYFISTLFLITIAIGSLSPIYAVEYQVINNATGTPGGTRFENEIGIPYTLQTLQLASDFILRSFKQSPDNGKNVEHITVTVASYAGPPAYTENKDIFVNSDYIQSFSGDVRIEVVGMLYHEVTHVWQWNGNGEAPSGLIEGIADYIRLKVGFASPHWAPKGSDSKWDEGYAVTAYFLDYCNGLKDGFVAELDAMMKDYYSPDFFLQLLGKSVDQLWNDYKSGFGNGN
ncbi:hypothetical protein SESBI_27721 [Sesbania bispinosa]|nr:hypothetical protein SESBI_27721 [Sesbania bispinosa]